MALPFPKSAGPSAAECRRVCDALASLHGMPSRGQDRGTCELTEPHTVLDSLVRTILSQNTTDITSQRAFTSLKSAFTDWEQVRTAPPGALENSIRVGGLADIKAARIKAILDSLLEERGELSLEHLRTSPGPDIKQQLSRYKGVGPKSIACVMMFCLGRDEFPVDTHVWEISKQLGWVPDKASREQTYQHLNSRVPEDIKYALHVLMVQHGKVCPSCSKKGGSTGKRKAAAAAAQPCPLAEIKRNRRISSSKGYSSSSSKGDGSYTGDVGAAMHSAADISRRKQKVAAAAPAAAAPAPALGEIVDDVLVKQEDVHVNSEEIDVKTESDDVPPVQPPAVVQLQVKQEQVM